MRNVLVFAALALFLLACAALSIPAIMPSSTPPPSQTPTMTPTSTPTLFTLPTFGVSTAAPDATPTTQGTESEELDCKVISQSIRNGAKFGPKERFDIGWKVRNTGTLAWDPGSTKFMYFSGAKMYESGETLLQAAVPPGTKTVLDAALVAPKPSGKYTTVWALRRGNDFFCRLSLSIVVP